jgi:hypothetical protein
LIVGPLPFAIHFNIEDSIMMTFIKRHQRSPIVAAIATRIVLPYALIFAALSLAAR